MKTKERIKAFFSNKEKVKSEVSDVLLVLAGSLVLALADALFIVPCQIINGGVDSLGILVNFYLQPLWGFDVTDIAIAIAQVALWLLGLWLLGIKFSIHTLLGSLAFPLFYSFIVFWRILVPTIIVIIVVVFCIVIIEDAAFFNRICNVEV